ncbi:hypothetical protein LOTGIDRAFT_228376 [Lottia gigantea]|uniref:Uncharacterized protein n=1 Tax=Lottia gigantea TaxID=225164 RepID=V4AKZ6_LOTGI|nr:hypothetical protein LOTGIDRAFT_228376 [Lottia gigantea]ESO97822.1 hypothetical protein LOTGIDRAFT_228376 [Lottia gigantea]
MFPIQIQTLTCMVFVSICIYCTQSVILRPDWYPYFQDDKQESDNEMPRFGVALCSIVLFVVLVSTLTESKSLSRQKRQLADLKTSELSALISLGGRYAPRGCKDVACGLVDIFKRRKRQADSGLMQLLTDRKTNDCYFGLGCGVEDVFARVRRSGADQRIAELQALIALTSHGGMVAHGQFDPLRIGKRNGNNEYLRDLSLEERYQLIRNILQRAAERKA